jgi:hypothetical protein
MNRTGSIVGGVLGVCLIAGAVGVFLMKKSKPEYKEYNKPYELDGRPAANIGGKKTKKKKTKLV